jgi:hypothetical protein
MPGLQRSQHPLAFARHRIGIPNLPRLLRRICVGPAHRILHMVHRLRHRRRFDRMESR